MATTEGTGTEPIKIQSIASNMFNTDYSHDSYCSGLCYYALAVHTFKYCSRLSPDRSSSFFTNCCVADATWCSGSSKSSARNGSASGSSSKYSSRMRPIKPSTAAIARSRSCNTGLRVAINVCSHRQPCSILICYFDAWYIPQRCAQWQKGGALKKAPPPFKQFIARHN